jgi:hypothetical protein
VNGYYYSTDDEAVEEQDEDEANETFIMKDMELEEWKRMKMLNLRQLYTR